MASAQDADEREDYVVRVVEFPGDTSAVIGALQRVFGLHESEARAILTEVPVDVRHGINRIRADYFRRALELSGARVEVRDGAGELVEPAPPQLTAAKPAAPRPPSAPLATPRSPAATIAGATPWQAKLEPQTPAAPDPNPAVDRSSAAFGRTLVLGTSQAPIPAAPQLSTALDGRTSLPQPAPQVPRMSGEMPPSAAGGWGDFQPFKEAAAPTATPAAAPVPRSPEQPRAPQPNAIGGPRELSTSDLPGSGGLELGPRLELSFSGPPTNSAAEGQSAHSSAELNRDGLPSGPPLELGVEERGIRESKPRYDAIPAGERWKAPGTDTLARARRQQMVHSLESGLADPRPSPIPPGTAQPAKPRVAATSTANTVKRAPTPPVSLGFWQVARLAVAGSATGWTLWIVGASSAVGAAIELYRRVPLAGAPLALVGMTLLIAVCGQYHRKIFWAAATGETELEDSPSFDLPALLRSGFPLAAFAAITQAVLWIWLHHQFTADRTALAIVGAPTLWVLGFGPGFYWPIALGTAAAQNRGGRAWDLARGLRALGREPGEVARVALAGGICFVASLALMTVVLSAMGIDGALGLFVAAGLPLALSHALMGAWTGRVLYARPDLFE